MLSKSFLDYLKSIGWFVISLVISSSNDALTKYIGVHIDPWQVAFFRCLFGTGSLLPLMFYHGSISFQTHRLWLQMLRGGLLFVAISLWSHGVKVVPITTATIMSFTVPIFVLLLAPIFLKERVTGPTWFAALLGFCGTVLVLQPSYFSFHVASLRFVIAAFVFGLLDIINKKYIRKEPLLAMLFYPTLVATILFAFPAMCAKSIPTRDDLLWLLILGISSNLILYFLLKAFALASVSSLTPFRYLELPISVGIGYGIFKELPTSYSYLGAALIILCTLLMMYTQQSNAK